MLRIYFILVSLVLVLGIEDLEIEYDVARYDNYRVYRCTPETEEQIKILQDMEATSDSYIFLKFLDKFNSNVDILVSPHKFADFSAIMERVKMNNFIIVWDFQKVLDESKIKLKQRSGKLDWMSYNTLDEIYSWMHNLQRKYHKYLKPFVAGRSYEGKQIRGLKLSKRCNNTGIFIEGGIHAREWISPATVTYILNQLLTSNDPEVQNIANKYDWYIVPVTNPDGYVYSHTKDRMWRKSRKPYGHCFGTDLNRNWDLHWGEKGVSSNPCTETYGGPKAFSETETLTMSKFLKKIANKIQIYLAFHAYSQYLLFPYGYTNKRTTNYDDLLHIGNAAAKSLKKRYGTQYKVGSIYKTIYPVSGSSVDWAYDYLNTTIAFIYELRPSPEAEIGFELPQEEIIPNGEEILDSIVTILHECDSLGYIKP